MSGVQARFAAWLLAVLLLTALFFGRVLPRLDIETDITALLPAVSGDAALEPALRGFADRASRRSVFLVGAPEFAQALLAAQTLARALRDSDVFTQVQLEAQQDLTQRGAAYGPARSLLLSDRHRHLLAAGQGAQLGSEALQGLYSPADFARPLPFRDDPLNLYGDFLAQQLPVARVLQLRDGVLSTRSGALDYVMLSAELSGNPFSVGVQRGAEPVLQQALAQARSAVPQAQILVSGVIRHAIANSSRAAGEISLFGSVSLFGVIVVLGFAFRSPRPLLLALLSLAIGSMVAITLCHVLFGRIHLLALVFGTSLVGVGVDYSLHFFADQFRGGGRWSGTQALRYVGPAIGIGVLTAALGYLALLLPPFPGLRQMAVLSVSGIVAAALCVLLAYPAVAGAGRAPSPPLRQFMTALARLSRPRHWRWLALLLLALVVAGLARLQFADDVRLLQASPPELLAEEQRARELVGGGADSRFFVVRADDSEGVLRAEEALRRRLDALVAEGALGGYRALSLSLPSRQRQEQNAEWLSQQVYAPGGALPVLFETLGYPAAAAQQAAAQFESQRRQPLSLEDWLQTPAAEAQRALWLGRVADRYASVVALSGVRGAAALQALDGAVPGTRLIDRVADISRVLKQFRERALAGLALALCAIAGVLLLRYGPNAGRHLLAPLGGCLLTLAVLGLCGIPANLFTVLALLLVLGLGVDYSVFLQEGSASRPTTLLAISLAGLTTLLAFGMLAASSTPFIASLGLGVLLGVAFTWMLAVMASAPASADNSTPTSALAPESLKP